MGRDLHAAAPHFFQQTSESPCWRAEKAKSQIDAQHVAQASELDKRARRGALFLPHKTSYLSGFENPLRGEGASLCGGDLSHMRVCRPQAQ